ncbi:two-component system, unclassified family, response regulator [Actinosynnema pretiosum]|nr:two-component system, unclassified family, response regulator [Actinosynnema pretiosum]
MRGAPSRYGRAVSRLYDFTAAFWASVEGAPRPRIDVLLVEDDPGDALLVAEALVDRPVELHVVRDGAEALEFLLRSGRYSQAPKPNLVLLDLNLPGLSGHEVLEQIKADPGLRSLPVVVFTSSAAEADLLASYRLRANAYVRKPLTADSFTEVVHRIDEFFGSVARLPS